MRIHIVIVLVLNFVLQVEAGPYISKCRPVHDFYTEVTLKQYDVTNDSFHIYSHDGYRFGYKYSNEYTRCIYTWTNNTDYVIKLEEIEFRTEGADWLTMYYTTFDEADVLNYEDGFYGKKGPGIKYSTANHMFLYFHTDETITDRGFELVISSIHKDDIPDPGMSTGTIVGIVFGVLALIAIIIAVVIVVILIWRRKRKSDSQQAEEPNPAPANQNEVVALSNSTNTATATNGNEERVDEDEPPPYESCTSIPPKSKSSSEVGIFV